MRARELETLALRELYAEQCRTMNAFSRARLIQAVQYSTIGLEALPEARAEKLVDRFIRRGFCTGKNDKFMVDLDKIQKRLDWNFQVSAMFRIKF
jgi:hypothetical protein